MKSIYQLYGKANVYSPWACNLYNGCPYNCVYCYNNHSLMSATVGGTVATIIRLVFSAARRLILLSKYETLLWQ